jgi:hypothetical protein
VVVLSRRPGWVPSLTPVPLTRPFGMTEELHSLFTRDGSLLVPTAAALGPWRPDALHGGAVSALLGNSLEEDGWQLARVTMDLLRRVPLEPLRLTAEARAGTRTILRKEAALGRRRSGG